MKIITTKVNRTLRLLRKLQKALPRLVLITMYKAFSRLHLEYGKIICENAYSKKFHQNFESF